MIHHLTTSPVTVLAGDSARVMTLSRALLATSSWRSSFFWWFLECGWINLSFIMFYGWWFVDGLCFACDLMNWPGIGLQTDSEENKKNISCNSVLSILNMFLYVFIVFPNLEFQPEKVACAVYISRSWPTTREFTKHIQDWWLVAQVWNQQKWDKTWLNHEQVCPWVLPYQLSVHQHHAA